MDNAEFDELIETEKNLVVRAKIMDVEGDVIELDFNYDGCVTINTEDLTYIALTRNNLLTMLELIEESEEWYDENLKTD